MRISSGVDCKIAVRAARPLTPSPRRGEGRDEGAPAVRFGIIVTPSPRPSPLRGEGVQTPCLPDLAVPRSPGIPPITLLLHITALYTGRSGPQGPANGFYRLFFAHRAWV